MSQCHNHGVCTEARVRPDACAVKYMYDNKTRKLQRPPTSVTRGPHLRSSVHVPTVTVYKSKTRRIQIRTRRSAAFGGFGLSMRVCALQWGDGAGV